MARVVITGAGAVCGLGQRTVDLVGRLREGRSALKRVSWPQGEAHQYSALAAPVDDFAAPAHYTRRQTRSMGRVALMAVRAAELAFEEAGLLGDPVLKNGTTGVAFGSSIGCVDALDELGHLIVGKSTSRLTATSYVRMMSHTATVNIDVFFGLTGRVLPTSSGCTSGAQGIGYAYEAIRDGHQNIMVAGGADELSRLMVGMFDDAGVPALEDASEWNTPVPFGPGHAGPVFGEGACALVLENYDHARARGAAILGEVVGFGTNVGTGREGHPDAASLEACQRLALADAGIAASDVGYVSACGLATAGADAAESAALHAVFGTAKPVSALKSYLGHTLAASGALEAWLAVAMMNAGWLAPTLGLDAVADSNAPLDYLRGSGRQAEIEHVMANAFAIEGINTSLLFRRVP
ncbi:MAG: beta-ketoacyl-ACP synthase [Pseudomonadota bacterium]